MITDIQCSEFLGIANKAIMYSGKIHSSLFHFLQNKSELDLNNEKVQRFSNAITYCDLIIQGIYEYIDREDPDCILPSHQTKLLSEDLPSPKRIHISLKRAKKNFQLSDEKTENLFDSITHFYYEIEKEYQNDI